MDKIERVDRAEFYDSVNSKERQRKKRNTKKVHKVHFSESLDAFGHDSGILVQPLNDVHINVHLGFIQVNHRYEVRFQFDSPPHLGSLSVRTQDPPNLNLRVLELKQVISSEPSEYRGSNTDASCKSPALQHPTEPAPPATRGREHGSGTFREADVAESPSSKVLHRAGGQTAASKIPTGRPLPEEKPLNLGGYHFYSHPSNQSN
ncbi:hypothetical protein HPB50_010988 [Hyalomma asiaticum]|uniref:Uncharacterized protein n=1 Tax=Hyalomma asiaticum TaxID=266040 RepID=A0ACB7TGD2_HYAAI|nr:hypothetical protein HPB50_010988 [Hyalomma asiaticum]